MGEEYFEYSWDLCRRDGWVGDCLAVGCVAADCYRAARENGCWRAGVWVSERCFLSRVSYARLHIKFRVGSNGLQIGDKMDRARIPQIIKNYREKSCEGM